MKSRIFRRANWAALAVGLGSWLLSGVAQAWTSIGSCGGQLIEHEDKLDEMRNRCSIPDGSAVHTAYLNAVNRWGEMSILPVTASWLNEACSIDLHDWNDEVALVNRDSIDGLNGMTDYEHENVCWLSFTPADYAASDSLIANDMDYTVAVSASVVLPIANTILASNPPDPRKPKGGGAMTFIHEIGHQLALYEEQSTLNVMSTGSRARPVRPSGSSGVPAPLADEIMGIANIYDAPKNVQNLFPVAARLVNGLSTTVQASDITACIGVPFTLHRTIMNTGSQNATITERVIADGPDGFGTLISRTTTVPSLSSVTISASVTIGAGSGTFDMKHEIDTTNVFAELSESDNKLTYKGKLHVIFCDL